MKILYIKNMSSNSKNIDDIVEKEFNHFLNEKNPEIIICYGGDGSMLHTIHNNYKFDVPFFGIAGGTENFLLNNISGDISKFLNKLQNNEIFFDILKTKLLKAQVERKGKIIFDKDAANDVIVGGGIRSFANFEVKTIESKSLDVKTRANALCISTPLGSTALNYNLEGGIIPNIELPLISYAMMAPIRKDKINKIINEQTIEIELKTDRYEIEIIIDGSDVDCITLEKNDKVIISTGSEIKMAFIDIKDFQMKRSTL